MLNWKFLRKKRAAILMALLTVLCCLIVADGILGARGHAYSPNGLGTYEDTGGSYYYNDRTGEAFFWVSMLVITSVFAFIVPWRDTWINLLFYFALYIPIALLFGRSPQHRYLFPLNVDAMISIGPDLTWLILPIWVPFWFWLIQSAIYWAVYPIKAIIKRMTNRRKGS